MVNNSTNINKTKESLNSDGQQFPHYQQNKRKFQKWYVNNSFKQQNKRKFKKW